MNADFLRDVIPYRCPKCGDSRKFTSLRDLKLHLNSEHAFKVGCVKPRTRTSIFDHKGHNSKKKVANHENLSRQWSSSLDSRRSSSESNGRDSPLLQSYKEDARMLERRLEKAREYESKNNRRLDLSRSHSYDPLDSALDKLNKDVLNARKNNWQSTDALYNAEEVMSGVETAAEERFQNQRNIIQNLVENLQEREHQLNTANLDIEKLHHDREKLMNEIEDVFKSADFGNKKIMQELEAKEKELSSLNDELSYIKQKTSDEIKEKDTKLLEAEKCLKQLEHERKVLEEERENLMEKVQTDSGLLRKTLEMKENQVRKLNLEMESIKREQEDMLSESMELYNTADKGTSKLKDLIRIRDGQLKEAEEELEQMKQLNDRLVWESRQLTEQADSHSQILHELLRQREDELSVVQDELKASLHSDKSQIVVQLQQEVRDKTQLLEQKEKELQSLKEFLTTTAQKEAVAREKLEKFITDLIDRADQAEKQLDCLKKYIADGRLGHDGKSKQNMESCVEESDSDDEMSDNWEAVERENKKPTFSPIRRQAPVKKRKDGCLGNASLVPSTCDSGYLDSKMASPRSVNLSSSLNRPDYCDKNNFSSRYGRSPIPINPEQQGDMLEASDKDRYTSSKQDITGRYNQNNGKLENQVNCNNRELPNQHHKYVQYGSSPPMSNNIIYIPYDRLTGQPVENHGSYMPRNHQKSFNRSTSNESSQLNSSQENSRSFPSSEYPDLPSRSLYRQPHQERSLSSTERQILPNRQHRSMSRQKLPGQGGDNFISSANRQMLPGVDNSMSSTERQRFPGQGGDNFMSSSNRQMLPGVDNSMSSTDRQRFPGQGGDNSLSDVLSIGDYDPQSENNSFQNIMDENGILWEPKVLNKQYADPRSPHPQYSSENLTNNAPLRQQIVSPRLRHTQYPSQFPMNNFPNNTYKSGHNSFVDPNRHIKAEGNSYMDSNRHTMNTQQPTLKLKMSDKFVEERRQFSENIKRILKLPFLREAENQAELTDDTLRNKLGRRGVKENKNNINSQCNGGHNVQLTGGQLVRNVTTDTRDCYTQTWMIDKNSMETDIHNPQNMYGKNLEDSKTSLLNDSSNTLNDEDILRDFRSMNNSRLVANNYLVHSEMKDSSSYSNLPITNKTLYNQSHDSQTSVYNPDSSNRKFDEKREPNNQTEKPRDLFDELKQESLMENNAILKPTVIKPAQVIDNQSKKVNWKTENKNETDRPLGSVVNKSKPLTGDSNGGTQKNVINNKSTDGRSFGKGISEDVIPVNKEEEKCSKGLNSDINTDNNSDMSFFGNVSESSRVALPKPKGAITKDTDNVKSNMSNYENESESSGISFPRPNATITTHPDNTGNTNSDISVSGNISESSRLSIAVPVSQPDTPIQHGTRTNNNSSIFSPQMSEDFEIIDNHTEEEVDSIIYDRSTESMSKNTHNGVVSDTESEGDLLHEEEVVLATDRRKSLSRQLSMDTGRNSLLDQFGEPDVADEPLGLMMEETLTPESVDKTFFAQPEVEDDYHHSVSSMDGFTLSRSSSQDSLLSERMTNYSKREATRRRRKSLCHVFSFLDTPSLITVALVCREWKKISRHPSLWKHVYLRHQKCSVQFLLNLAKWCSSMETLHIEDLKVRDKKEFESSEDYHNRVRAVLEPGLEKLLQVSESTLKTATIIHCENIITDKGLWLVSCYSRMVRKVTYICNEDLPGADVIWALGAGCRDITHLNVTMTDPSSAVGVKFNNKCLQVVSQFCQDLQTLCIGGTEIDINGLVLIAKHCQRLLTLELHYAAMVTEDTMVAVCRLGFHNLQKICFNFTPIESKAILRLCKSAKHLQRIQVSLDISCFDLKGELQEDEKMKKYSAMVKNLKELEKKPGVGNILKLNCGEVSLNTEKKFFGLF